jgi:endonuclease YncB( thermonuclease family)
VVRQVSTAALTLLLGLGLLVVMVSPGAAAAAYADKDCADFPTQASAQTFFLNNNPSADPHRLDADGDGIACESNPCPCSTSGGGDQQPVPFAPLVPEAKRERARVIRVVDGDTVKVRLRSRPRIYVRLLGIDTPEVYGGTECHGPEASTAAERMLPRGTKVRLRSDPTQDLKDRYGRLLRYVAKGRLDVNRKLVVRGHARVYVYDRTPFQRTASYRRAQAVAKKLDRGLWSAC